MVGVGTSAEGGPHGRGRGGGRRFGGRRKLAEKKEAMEAEGLFFVRMKGGVAVVSGDQ